jgi:hypothetical protein
VIARATHRWRLALESHYKRKRRPTSLVAF